ANVNSFTIVSLPVGAVDNSNPTGGANGTGFLKIDNVSIPANGTVTIVFDVTVDPAVVPGTLIDNSATIFNPSGTGATPHAPTVIVSASSVPISGNKPLYISAPDTDLSRDLSSITSGSRSLAEKGGTQTWTLSDPLQTSITVSTDLNPTIPINLYLGNTGRGDTRDITVELSCTTPAATFGPVSLTVDVKDPTWHTISLPFPNPAPTTVTCNDSWQLTITNDTAGGGRKLIVYSDDGTTNSHVLLPSLDVINVKSVEFHNVPYPGVSPVTSVSAGSILYIRSVVSDPFGSFDITDPELTLIDAGSPQVTQVLADTMTEVNDSGAATKTYEYAYTIPAFPAQGNWTARVESFEGTEGTISHTRTSSFEVLTQPLLTVLKSANSPTATPGGTITYTIQITNNGGSNATAVTATDPVAQYTSYVANSTLLNGITVTGDGATSPLIGGLLVDDDGSRGAGAAATGIIQPGNSAIVTFEVEVQ
ncbi:MAG: DUF11 domain-containing protein, partial [Deltaproteobacteria bacterium]|nr:DUF11 domain-containing protein [Deltaproteobacteria bacterium]